MADGRDCHSSISVRILSELDGTGRRDVGSMGLPDVHVGKGH